MLELSLKESEENAESICPRSNFIILLALAIILKSKYIGRYVGTISFSKTHRYGTYFDLQKAMPKPDPQLRKRQLQASGI